MENKHKVNSVKPQGIRIEVTENGVLTANVHVPLFVAKMGLIFGQNHSKKKENAENELDRLKDIDMDAILKALDNGVVTLPCLLVEVDEPDKNEHVKITLE